MQLSNEEIRKIARLAKLEFDDGALSRFGEQMNVIVEYISQLNSVDTSGEETHVERGKNEVVLRGEDWMNPDGIDTRSDFLSNVPKKTGEYIKVPSVF